MAIQLPDVSDLKGPSATRRTIGNGLEKMRGFLADLFGTDGKAATSLAALGILDSDGRLPASMATTGLTRKNLLINGNPLINQRGYVSGTATTGANEYTLDRWRVVTSGQNLTFSTALNVVTMTLPVDGIEQVIEGLNIQSGTHVISFVATGDTVCKVDGVTKVNGGTFTLTGGTNSTIKFSSASGAGTVKLIQIELGSIATDFEHRPFARELELCKRYFERINWDDSDSQTIGMGAFIGTTSFWYIFNFTEKRVGGVGSAESSAYTTFNCFEGDTSRAISAIVLTSLSKKSVKIDLTVAASTNRSAGYLRRNSTDTCFVEIDAEL